MTPRQLLEQRERQINTRLLEISGIEEQTDELTAETDRLLVEKQGLQTRMNAAQAAEDAAIAAAPPAAAGGDPAVAEALGAASVANIIDAFTQHRMVAGPEADLQTHFGLDANEIPLAMITPRPVALAEDHDERQRRALTLTGDGAAMQQPTVGGMYPTGELAWCGAEVVPVDNGLAVFPYVSVPASSAASAPAAAAAGAEVGDTDNTIQLLNLSPNRIQQSFTYQQEQQRLVRSVPEDLQVNLNDLVQSGVTRFGLTNGTKGLLTRGTAPADPTAVATWATVVSAIGGAVDGVYARRLRDVRLLCRVTSYALFTSLYRADETDVTVAEWLEEKAAGVMASAFPSTATNFDQGLLVRGMHGRSAVMPLWDGLQLTDAMTESKSGLVRVTVAAFTDIGVTRPGVFARTVFQVA